MLLQTRYSAVMLADLPAGWLTTAANRAKLAMSYI